MHIHLSRTNRKEEKKKTNKQNVKRKNIKIIFVRCVEISCHQNNKFCCTSDERSTFCREKILLNEMVEHHLKTENEKDNVANISHNKIKCCMHFST